MNSTRSTEAVADSNRSYTIMGVTLILASLVVGWWLATSVGYLATALWMVLYGAVGVIFISLGRHPDAER
ncbi:MAG: hypothetical protein ACQEQY_04035 [Halobacteriota archaeon]